MRILLIEPWLGGSHEGWAVGLARHSRHEVHVVGLPPEAWRWRLRAGAQPLAVRARNHIAESGPPDLLLVSGLVDVSVLLGLLRADVAPSTPVVTYMHESQIAYPTVSGNPDEEAVLRNWSTWLASDVVMFNSQFHLDAVTRAMPSWLGSRVVADQRPFWDDVAARFDVLPLGVDVSDPPPMTTGNRLRPSGRGPVVLWPHRWEPDKAPEVFRRAVDRLVDRGLDFTLVLAGEDPSGSADRAAILGDHGTRVRAVGPFARSRYLNEVAGSDIVVSCADHEFFGVAVVEAMRLGCVPLLPDDLSYPELVPDDLHADVLYQRGTFGSRLEEHVVEIDSLRHRTEGLASAMRKFDWDQVVTRYDDRMEEIVDARARDSEALG